MKTIKRVFSVLLIIGLLATTALLFNSCGEASGLEFELNSAGDAYTCVGFAEGKSAAEAVIPETYKGKPVTAIGAKAFSENAIEDMYASLLGGKKDSEEKVPLTSVTIPDSVTVIGAGAFSDCEQLKTYNLPANLVTIGSQAFVRAGITGEVKIPATVTEIGTAAFAATNITSATLPEGMKVIPAEIFSGCEKLSSITFSDTLTAISENAFYGCKSLTSFDFPATLEEIGDKAFGECVGFKEINIPTTVTTLGSQIFIDTSEELVVNVSYDSERPAGWSEFWFAGMKGKAMNTSEAYYNNVVLANQAAVEALQKQIDSCKTQYESISNQMESINKTKQDLQGRYSVNPPDSILQMISNYQKEINDLNMQRAEVGRKLSELEEQLEDFNLSGQLN